MYPSLPINSTQTFHELSPIQPAPMYMPYQPGPECIRPGLTHPLPGPLLLPMQSQAAKISQPMLFSARNHEAHPILNQKYRVNSFPKRNQHHFVTRTNQTARRYFHRQPEGVIGTSSLKQPCCHLCGEEGHMRRNCRHQSAVRCFTCGGYSHKAKSCPF